MANRRTSKTGSEQAIIDTTPATGGYWTNSVLTARSGFDIEELFLSVRGSGSVVPTLQFRVFGTDTEWTDYYNDGVAFVSGDIYVITTKARYYEWRIGVKVADYTSGEIAVGLNWKL